MRSPAQIQQLRDLHLKNTGRKVSQETRLKMSLAKRGKFDQDATGWKGDNIKYRGLHHWVERKLGRPNKCEHCKTTKAKVFDWANISGQYLRDLNDWIRLCRSCHIKYDKEKINE